MRIWLYGYALSSICRVESDLLWADITDIERHFEIEVPRRACSNSVLRYAVFAFSSRHLHRFERGDQAEALRYHNKCLELLIPIISEHEDELTEDVLAAVAILRQDEEMEGLYHPGNILHLTAPTTDFRLAQDNCFHLHGVTQILNRVSSFCSGGGLGEAAAWLSLRQDIYVSLVTQRPLRTQLPNFEQSASLKKNNDMCWANRIVLLLANTLSIAFIDFDTDNDESMRRLGDRVECWNRDKPATFEPIKYVPRDKKSPQRFPIIWMLNPFHVLGIQYYHITKIVLAISTSRPEAGQRYAFGWGRKTESRVRAHLLTVLGVAKSNPKAENTLFTARHCLSVWGGVLTHRLDREAAINFLEEVEERTGWTASELIANLKDQWDNSDDD